MILDPAIGRRPRDGRIAQVDLALFDLDNTLLAGDSDYAWAQFLIARGVLDRARYEARNDAFYKQYLAGELDIREFLEFQLAPIARRPRAELDAWHAEFMREKVLPMILPKARALVARHRERGDVCAILTSTNTFITAPIARELGVAHLLATELETCDEGYTGRPSGTPCFREGKIERLSAWLAARGETLAGYAASWFSSDSLNDLPLLETVTHPVAVDPDETLRCEALARGWPVITLK
jgi:HAD superfamily hydrolase (TIGR01490 family)